jgi:hypothetical protein
MSTLRHTPGALLRQHAATAHTLIWMIRNHRLSVSSKLITDLVDARLRMACARSEYRELSSGDLLARRTSSRVFVFGSGYSINDISDDQWSRFSRDDTLGFSGSLYMRRVPLTFLLLRAWTETSAGSLAWRKDAEEVLEAMNSNPFLARTTFALQAGMTAVFANRLVGHRLWPRDRDTYFFISDKLSRLPHRNLENGIVHGKSTLCSAISLAVALGYDEIVLVGVDLYDSRYFWLPADKTLGWSAQEERLVPSTHTVRGAAVSSVHNTVINGIVDYLGEWGRGIQQRYGVRLSVFNPRSLLIRTLPQFAWED